MDAMDHHGRYGCDGRDGQGWMAWTDGDPPTSIQPTMSVSIRSIWFASALGEPLRATSKPFPNPNYLRASSQSVHRGASSVDRLRFADKNSGRRIASPDPRRMPSVFRLTEWANIDRCPRT